MRVLSVICFLLLAHAPAAQAKQKLAGPFPFEVLEVIDGDTFRARVDIWLGQSVEVKVRLKGVDTPELRGKCAAEKKLAIEAKQFAAKWLRENPAQLVGVHYGTYAGRVLATIENKAAANKAAAKKSGGTDAPKTLSAALLSENLAKPYRGRKARWCA